MNWLFHSIKKSWLVSMGVCGSFAIGNIKNGGSLNNAIKKHIEWTHAMFNC